ncbi:2941_t:CDS:2 [Ambispora gerdemannii]|uniref:2941_t:CDS:1 n=1 Tax=Ambispora gerdemannii TaxID=144530 RepID=A0A9N8W6F7_9GLOM|nr:2941_t:CDS:2 [Ambispora gerdemannii]
MTLEHLKSLWTKESCNLDQETLFAVVSNWRDISNLKLLEYAVRGCKHLWFIYTGLPKVRIGSSRRL